MSQKKNRNRESGVKKKESGKWGGGSLKRRQFYFSGKKYKITSIHFIR